MSDRSVPAASAPVRCPVCASVCDDQPLFTYTVKRAALHFCPPWRDQNRHERFIASIRKLWGREETQIRRCPHCGFAFGDPFVGGDETFYRTLHEQMGYPAWRWDYDVALGHPWIARISGGRALDIGAGSGAFLEKLGPAWEKHAVESSDITRGVLEKKGIPAQASLGDASLEALRGKFQLITLFQVLEHVSEFYPLLRRCHELLAPGGVLFITVPDGDAMAEQERMTGCPDMPPNHINRWTPSSLEFVLQRVGLVAGQAVPEPSSWSKVSQNLYLTILADAAKPDTLAAKIYKIRRKSLRAPLLRLAGGLALFRLLRFGGRLRRGGAFALAAIKDAP